jgi:hypothetical protein
MMIPMMTPLDSGVLNVGCALQAGLSSLQVSALSATQF